MKLKLQPTRIFNMFKYEFLSLITQLSVIVPLLYFTQKHITYFIEIKEENSRNIFLITVNEYLRFTLMM